MSFDRINKAEDGTESVKHVKRMLYHRMNVVPQKKVMTFNRHLDDFQFHASYTELDFLNEEEKRWEFVSAFCDCLFQGFNFILTKLNQFG